MRLNFFLLNQPLLVKLFKSVLILKINLTMKSKGHIFGGILIVGVVGLLTAGAARASVNADLSLADPTPFDAAAAGPAANVVISSPINPPDASGPIAIPQVPEPATLALAGLGAASLLAWRRRKN